MPRPYDQQRYDAHAEAMRLDLDRYLAEHGSMPNMVQEARSYRAEYEWYRNPGATWVDESERQIRHDVYLALADVHEEYLARQNSVNLAHELGRPRPERVAPAAELRGPAADRPVRP